MVDIQSWYLLSFVLGGIGVLTLNRLHRLDGGHEEQDGALLMVLSVVVPILNIIIVAYSQWRCTPRIVKAIDRYLSKRIF